MLQLLADHLTPSQLITDIMAIAMIFGAIDYFRSNKWGLGEKFSEAFSAFSSLALMMVGIISLVPLIGKYVAPWIAPAFAAMGVDPAMFAGLLLANDIGGFQLAGALSSNPDAVRLGGMLLASMMGVNIVFNIPVALSVIGKEDRAALARGMSCGFITLPLGCLAGSLAAGYGFLWTLANLLPVIAVAAILALLLRLAPQAVVRIFTALGRVITAAALFGTTAGIFSAITGLNVIPDLAPVQEGFDVVISIMMILPGAYVLVHLLTRLLARPFRRLGALLGINALATAGLVATMANAIPTFSMIRDMDERGKVINFAFIVSAGYLLGDHLAFCTALSPDFVLPLLVGKLVSGVTAVALAALQCRAK